MNKYFAIERKITQKRQKEYLKRYRLFHTRNEMFQKKLIEGEAYLAE